MTARGTPAGLSGTSAVLTIAAVMIGSTTLLGVIWAALGLFL